jgi:hypothetical protein
LSGTTTVVADSENADVGRETAAVAGSCRLPLLCSIVFAVAELLLQSLPLMMEMKKKMMMKKCHQRLSDG